jgi:predicted lipoprotein with Yx(FWY)xxD motif
MVGLGLLTGCTSASQPRPRASESSSPGTISGVIGGNPTTTVEVEQSRFGPVLTDGTGYTLYWFAKDTPGKSACLDICVSQWPPVTGAPQPAPGISLPGSFGTFVRSDGARQATYDGHPLYTYAGDPEPGEIGGNDVYEFGGYWYAMTVTAVTPAPSPDSPVVG